MDIQSDYFLTSINQIDQKLFLGGILGANNPNLIARNNIKAIVSILSPNAYKIRHKDLNYLELALDDLPNENIERLIPEALAFIKCEIEKGNNVLIHCAAGVSRSASIAIAFFMVYYNLPFDKALEKTREGRRCAYPNPGFERQLKGLQVGELRRTLGLIN